MVRKANQLVEKPVVAADEVDALYVEFLHHFYEKGNLAKAREIAARLENTLATSTELSESIRGEEIRSLSAELRGDFHEAIRSREAEIRKILELHALTVKTPGWDYVATQYDFSDVSDRLDLLASLYDRQGQTDRAIATLRESRQYCSAHQIDFGGQELLDELEQTRKNGHPQSERKRKRRIAE